MKLFVPETIHEGNTAATRNIQKRICLATPWGKIPILWTKSREENRRVFHETLKNSQP